MALLEALAISIGPVIAKYILKVWLGEGVTNDIGAVVVDLLVGKSKEQIARYNAGRYFAEIGETVALQVEPLYRNEFSSLSTNDRKVVAFEVAATIEKANINADILVDLLQDPVRLYQYLRNSRVDATTLLAEDQTNLYYLLLRQISIVMMEYIHRFADYDRLYKAKILNNEDEIIKKINRLFEEPLKDSIEFENSYCSFIKDRFGQFDMFGIDRADNVVLRQEFLKAFVDPSLLPTEKIFSSIDEDKSETVLTNEKNKFIVYGKQLLSIGNRIIIRGDAGSGKSTLLKWLCIQSAGALIGAIGKNDRLVPFFIRMRDFIDRPFPHIEKLADEITKSGYRLDKWADPIFQSGRAVLFIDGIDELPISARKRILEELEDWIYHYPLAHFVISSRPYAISEEQWPEWQYKISSLQFLDLTLQPMSDVLVKSFVENWFRALDNTVEQRYQRNNLPSYPENLLRLISTRPSIQKLVNNPLLCAMICSLYYERQESLPFDRVSLYEDCIKMLLYRRDQSKKVDALRDFPILSSEDLLSLISGFAYWLVKNGYSDADTKDADDFFEKERNLYGIEATTGQKIREFYVNITNLLREPELGRVDFHHRTFQEYLAANAAVNENDIGLLVQHSTEDQWREVIILAIGEAYDKQSQKLVGMLLDRADKYPKNDDRRRYLTLLCLESLESRSSRLFILRDRILNAASEYIPPRNRRDAEQLAKVGDPAIALLKYKSGMSETDAAMSVYILSLIGSPSALSAILDFAIDSRTLVVKEIGSAWKRYNVDDYYEKVITKLSNLYLDFYPEKMNCLDLSFIKELTLSGDNFVDLSIVSYFPNLTSLDAHNTNISNLNPVSKLSDLVYLDVRGTLVADISPLSGDENLSKLNLRGTPVSNLHPLLQLKNLELLHLSEAGNIEYNFLRKENRRLVVRMGDRVMF